MAKELNLDLGISGLTVTARLVLGAAYVGGVISCPEVAGLPGYYSGSVPAGIAAGAYQVRFLNGVEAVGSGTLYWDGTAEVSLLQLARPEDLAITLDGGFGESDRNTLAAVKALAEADEVVTPTRYQKRAAGAGALLLDKDVANDGAGNISLTKRP